MLIFNFFRANYDNVTELVYLDMVLSESMRVYPPIPLHIGQCLTVDVEKVFNKTLKKKIFKQIYRG